MELSARNQLKATISAIELGEVMATVAATLPDGQNMKAAITKDAVEALGLSVGQDVVLVIKATEIIVATP
jgi:molybdate transport system regulatory protein